jgi:hypothetical protein
MEQLGLDFDEQGMEDEEVTELSLTTIYNELLVHNELLLTIPATEEQILRKGLAGAKSKQNTKLREAGLQPDNNTLAFQVTPGKIEGTIQILVSLTKRAGIRVLDMKVPDNEI